MVATAVVALALTSPVLAQDAVPDTGTAIGSGTIGDSIRNEPANPAPPAASAPQPVTSDDSSGDSISVTGGVPGTPPSAPASDTSGSGSEAQPAVVTAPAEAAPSAPAVAIAPAPAAPSAPDVPVTAADVAPAAAPSIATTTTAAGAVAPESTPVTTAATAPAGALAPPMTLAPLPAESVAPEVPVSAPSAAAAAASPASTTAPTEAVAARKPSKATTGGETKLASNPPQQNGPFGGMEFGNNKAPIDIRSESMSLDYQNHSVLWVGNVRATQADAQLTSDQLRVNYFDKDFKQMKDMVADGNVRLSQGTRWATGKHGVMDQTKRTVVLTGSPVAHEGNDQITGCKITVYLNTSQSVVDCAHAVLFPHSEASPGASATPAAATD